jgi:choline dehydrogenase
LYAEAFRTGLLEMFGFCRVDNYLEKDPSYRKAKAANGGLDPFSPEGQPHFDLDFVCAFGSAFQWQYPAPREGDHITVMVDLVRPVTEGPRHQQPSRHRCFHHASHP